MLGVSIGVVIGVIVTCIAFVIYAARTQGGIE